MIVSKTIGYKQCSHCELVKPESKFRKTKKTLDGFYPFCTECSMKHKYYMRTDARTVALHLWNDVMDMAFENTIGTKVYYNKTMFIDYVMSYPTFKKLYQKWLVREYNTCRICIKFRKGTGSFSLENFEFYLRDLEDDETIELIRTTPTAERTT